jgi:sugar lactone lactonase YvrE
MKRNVILIMLSVALVAAFTLVGDTISAKTTKNTFHGLGKVLVQGSPIHGANGIMFDDNDMLYIASVIHWGEIVIMDPKSGTIVDRLGPDQGVLNPDDLAFGPDGSLYWTSIMAGEVCRLTPDGVLSKQFVASGVNPITFSDDGRLFVALDFLGDGLYELDPNLVLPPRLIIPAPLGFLNGMDWGPDGLLYGPLWIPGEVVRIDVDSVPAVPEVVASGFGNPAAVKFDSQGNLYVADQMTGEISRIDIANGGEPVVIASGLPGLDNIAFDSQDRLFVSHAQDGSIHQILPSGEIRTVSKGGMITPGGVAVVPQSDGGESVFVADLWTVREFDGQTGKPGMVERHDLAVPGDITSAFTVSTYGQRLVLSSWFGNAVQIWNPETRLVEKDLVYPPDLHALPMNAIGLDDDLIIAELVTSGPFPHGRVARVNPDDLMDRETLAEGQIDSIPLIMPIGLAAMGEVIWVSDWATGIVWQISPGSIVPVAMGLSAPEGLAIDLDGSLLVVESGAGRLSRIVLSTAGVSTVVEGLELGQADSPLLLPTLTYNGVAVGPSGHIYVTGGMANVLYRFKPSAGGHE